jgi:HEAT repeat protein
MPTLRRFLSRRWLLALLGASAMLFGLAMLHPYPRQSLFGPTIRGQPRCVWEAKVWRSLDREGYEKSLTVKMMRWFGFDDEPIDENELFNHAEMVPLLLEMTVHADPEVRGRAIGLFYWYPKLCDKSALPVLRARLDDEDVPCRIEASMAVVTIDPKEPVLPVLLHILNDLASPHRYAAMHALNYLSGADAVYFDAMVRHAKDSDQSVRNEVMYALHCHGKRGVPTLMQGIEDPNVMVRNAALESLASVGPDAKKAVPALETRLADTDKDVRTLAKSALLAIDPERYEQLKRERKIE